MPLPAKVRKLTPDGLRDNVHVRAVALASGLIPPRPMHSEAEAKLLQDSVRGRRAVAEIGVYEGSSAVRLCEVLGPETTFHLIDPYINRALRPGQRGVPWATRRAVSRAADSSGPRLEWHVVLSEQAAQGWSEPLDVVFIDGDHSEPGCRLDWDLWHGFVKPGGVVLFHDAREGQPDGYGLPGPTAVVDKLFRGAHSPAKWRITAEVDSLVSVTRSDLDPIPV